MIKKAKNKYVFLFGFLVVVYCFILTPKAVAFFEFNLNDNGGFLSLDSVKDFLNEKLESLNQIDYEGWVESPARQATKKAIIITRDNKLSAVFSLASVFSSVKDTVVKIPQGIMDYILPPRSFNHQGVALPQGDTLMVAKQDEFKKTIQEQKLETERALSVVKSIEQKYNDLQREMRNIRDGGLKIVGPVIEKKTIEKTLEKTISGLPAYSAGISQDKLDSGISALKTELNNINTNLINQINNLSSQTGRQNSATFQAIALTNRIDNLSGTKLSNITVSGVSGLTDADIPDGITASLYLPLTGGTLTGNLIVSGAATSTIAGDTNFDSGVLYVDSINNRVGVGTTSPSDTLSLNGPAYFSQISAPSVTTDRLYNTSGDLYWNSNLIGSASVGNWTLSSGNVYRSSGNVGIGTTSPFRKLSVAGRGWFDDDVTSSYFTATSSTASVFPYASSTALTVSGSIYLTGLGQGWLHTAGGTNSLTASTSPTVAWLTATTTNATSTFAGGLAVETSGLVYDYSTNRVGIGTASPGSVFHISPADNGKIILGTLNSNDYTGGVYVQGANGGNNGGFVSISRGNITPDPANAANFIKMQENMTDLIGYIGLGVSDDFAIITGLPAANSLPANGTTRLTIKSAGNVGIGTTSPSTKLSVGGAAGDTTGHGYFTGGLGVGILNTTANTFRVGQCVTGDTKLRRRRKRKNSELGIRNSEDEPNSADDQAPSSKLQALYIYDEVAIKDIVAGDEIASLDEKTGKIVWSKVKQLAYMGKKPIIELVTALGRKIRTTGNHPYLVKAGSDEARQKPRVGVFIDNANLFYAERRAGWRVDLRKFRTSIEESFNVKFVNYYRAVPDKNDPAYAETVRFIDSIKDTVIVKTKTLKYIEIAKGKYEKKGDMDVEIVLDVVRSIDNLDAVILVTGDSDFVALRDYILRDKRKEIAFVGFKHNLAWELRNGKYAEFEKTRLSLELGVENKTTPEPKLGRTLVSLLYSRPPSVSSGGVWKKVSGLKIGQEIAVINRNNKPVWDKIIDMRQLPTEDVYDIEIENTHNFIGNDIVAHNTAFMVDSSGSVGIGTTSPYAKLSVEGSSALGNSALAGYFTATTSTASVFPYASTTAITVSGNSYLGTVSSGLWNGTLIGVPYGGTGWAAIQSGTIPYGNGTSALSTTTAGTAGNVLAFLNGVPTWTATSTLAEITGTLSVSKGGTGQTSFSQGWLHSDGSTFTSSTSPTVNYITATSTTATSTFAGGVSFGKDLAFTNTATSSVTMANGLNFDNNTFVIDPNSGFVGVGTTSPAYKLDVNGGSGLTSRFTRTSSGSGSAVNVISLQVLSSTGVGDTGLGASLQYQIQNSVGSLTEATVIRGLWNDATSASEDSSIAFLTRLNGTVAEKVRIDNNGNLGIGTTSPSTKLSVGGAAGDTTGHGYFTGGLGVGILNTTANTFRVGQCVTGDTKLRRRRRKKSVGKRSALFGDSRADLEETDFDDGYIYDEVAIKDIAAGDEIASLDEKTGKIVWSKVKQLAYMGKKPTFKLTTEDGRQIRTTANHPYLAEQGWTKVSDLRVGTPIAVPQNKGKGRQKPRIGVFVDGGNMYHTSNRSGWRVDFDKLKKLLSVSVDLAFINYHIVTPQENDKNYSKTLSHVKIASKSFTVLQKPMKYIWSEEEKRKVKKGDVDVDLAIDVVNSISELDAAVVISGDSDYLALENYTAQYGKPVIFMGYKQNMAWELRLKNHIFLELLRKFIEYGAKTNSDLSAGATLTSFIIHNAILESSAAVDNSMAWVKIRSIEPVAEEDVYDVEIENTHNFIAGHFVDVRSNTSLTQEQEELFIAEKKMKRALQNLKLGVWNLDSYNNNNEYEREFTAELRKIAHLARKHGIDAGDLQDFLSVSETGDVWTDQSITQSGNINTAQHRRGQWQGDKGIRAFSYDGGDISERGVDDTRVGAEVGVPYGEGTYEFAQPLPRLDASNTKTYIQSALASLEALSSKLQIPESESIAFGGIVAHNTAFMVDSSGNVGIGTTSPFRKLSVAGRGWFDDDVTSSYFTATSSTASVFPYASTTAMSASGSAYAANFVASSASATSTFAGGLNVESGGLVYNYSTNNVGIGTAAPTAIFDINDSTNNGRLVFSPSLMLNAQSLAIGEHSSDQDGYARLIGWADSAGFELTGNYNPNTSLLDGNASNTGTLDYTSRQGLLFQGLAAGGTGSHFDFAFTDTGSGARTTSSKMRILATGNIGIGTTSPYAKLSVEGSSALGNSALAGYFIATSTTATSTFAGGLNVENGGLVYDYSTGYVGIGTSTSTKPLVIYNTTPALGIMAMGGGTRSLQFGYNGDYTEGLFTSDFFGGELDFRTGGVTQAQRRMIITAGGNVGIGTTSPSELLHIQGTVIRLDRVSTDYGAYFNFYRNGSQKWKIGGGVSAGGLDDMQFLNSSSANILTLLQTGNVGVGTTSPYAKLSVEGSSALGNSALAGYFTATTSTASVFPYASTTALTVSGNSYLGTISSGLWNGTLIGVPYGGTGWAAVQSGTIPYGNGTSALSTTTAGTAGNVLAFLNGVPTWTATSTLANITGTLSVAKGGTGQTSFGQGWLNSDGTTLSASTSPTVAWLTATSTTATSTFAGGLNVENGGLVYDFTSNNVGIGLANPAYKLEVNGSASTTNLYLPAASTTVGIIYSGTNRFIHNFGTDNFFAGVNAGNLTTTGTNNNAIGYQALAANTTGHSNNAIGSQSLFQNTTGARNQAIGLQTLYSNTTGNDNVAIGQVTLFSNIVGVDNVAVGSSALEQNLASLNVAIGQQAGQFLTTGANNTYIGSYAGNSNATGGANVNIGYRAGYGVSGNSYNNSVLIGYYAGDGLTTGSRNIIIGLLAGDNITTGSDNLIIGYNIDAPSATASNQLNIGNLIFSKGIDGTGTTLSTGNIGIGTTSPYAKLSVEGSSALGNSALAGYFTATTTNATSTFAGGLAVETSGLVYDYSTNRVGIGTAAPAYPLDVLGTGTGAIIARFNDVNSTGCTLATGGTISCSSDISLKKNIEDIDDGLNKVLGLHPVLFNWKSEDDPPVGRTSSPVGRTSSSSDLKNLGFIAQEVELILPKLVSTENGGIKQLNTIGMIPLLTKAIQEQQVLIEGLKQAMASTTGLIASLSATPATPERSDGGQAGTSGVQSSSGVISQSFAWILEQFKISGVVFEYDALKVKNIEAEKVKMNEICIGNTCVTEDQFKAVFGSSGASSSVGQASSSQAGSSQSAISLSASSSSSSNSSPEISSSNSSVPSTAEVSSSSVSSVDSSNSQSSSSSLPNSSVESSSFSSSSSSPEISSSSASSESSSNSPAEEASSSSSSSI